MENKTTTIEVNGQIFTVEAHQGMYDVDYRIRLNGEHVAVALTEDKIEQLCIDHLLYGDWTEKVNCRFD